MKKVTTLILAAACSLPALGHDCECDCTKSSSAADAVQQAVVEPAKPVVAETPAPVAGADEPAAKAAAPATEEKSVLQKFLDHPPADDKAKKRLKKH